LSNTKTKPRRRSGGRRAGWLWLLGSLLALCAVLLAAWLLFPKAVNPDRVIRYFRYMGLRDKADYGNISFESAQGNAYMDANFSNAVDMDEVLVIKYDSSDSTQTSNVTVLANKIGELLGTKYNSKVSITDVGSYKGDADNIAVEIFSVKTTDTSIKSPTRPATSGTSCPRPKPTAVYP
jgi:hypothetical protein